MTNAYQVYTAARQLLEGYTAAMQPLCRREGLGPNGWTFCCFWPTTRAWTPPGTCAPTGG